jgi:hypothetical protein
MKHKTKIPGEMDVLEISDKISDFGRRVSVVALAIGGLGHQGGDTHASDPVAELAHNLADEIRDFARDLSPDPDDK